MLFYLKAMYLSIGMYGLMTFFEVFLYGSGWGKAPHLKNKNGAEGFATPRHKDICLPKVCIICISQSNN
jgi:hypothetical protein